MDKKQGWTPGPTMDKQYSEDRNSLAQELRDTLRTRGHWTPPGSGPDLISAVAIALDKAAAAPELAEALDIALRVLANSELRNSTNCVHAACTKAAAALAKARGES